MKANCGGKRGIGVTIPNGVGIAGGVGIEGDNDMKEFVRAEEVFACLEPVAGAGLGGDGQGKIGGKKGQAEAGDHREPLGAGGLPG